MPIDFVTPVKKDGPPNGPTEVISGTTRLLYSSHVMYVGIAGDGNNVVKTVSPDVPNAVTIEDAGVTGGIRWFRLSRAHGDKFKLQAKDAKGVVVTSCELSVIELPGGSGPLEFGVEPADPKSPNKINLRVLTPKDDAGYIDTRMTDVAYNIYQFGFLVYCRGMSLPIHVPESMVDLNPTTFEAIDAKVYDTLAQANEAIRRAPAKAKGVKPFAYYRGAGGAVISPTMFSPATAPRTIATFLEARRLYAEFVQNALAGLAISLAGGVILRMGLGPLLRAFTDPKPPRAVPPPVPNRRISPPPDQLPGVTKEELSKVRGGALPTGEPTVWVQLRDGRVREYKMGEVNGPIKPGNAAVTPEGPGRIVKVGDSHGDAPWSRQVRHLPFKPLLTPEELNQPVPMRRGLNGNPRPLNPGERINANKIQDVLRRFQEGDEAALRQLANFRAKPLTGDLAGWTELDLLPGNPGALNQMRVLIRIDASGKIEARLLQMH
jgi:hypothetical protein